MYAEKWQQTKYLTYNRWQNPVGRTYEKPIINNLKLKKCTKKEYRIQQ